jgi:ribosomal protein L32
VSLPRQQWHAQFAACVDCGRADRPHIAKGRCEGCYRRGRAAARRGAEDEDGVTALAPRHRNWHLSYPSCRGCGKTNRPHHAEGFCPECYRAARNLGERGREEIPVAMAHSEPTLITSRQPRGGTTEPPEAPTGAEGAVSPSAAPAARHTEAPPAPSPPARRPPILYARHVRVIRTYRLNCPNCGEPILNPQTGTDRFGDDELAPAAEVGCGTCGAWWSIGAQSLAEDAAARSGSGTAG